MNERLIEKLNEALGWELRAQVLYAHYAAYVKGIYRLQLAPHFAAEAAESVTHADQIRQALVKQGGVAVTKRDTTPIEHTTDYRAMLTESFNTEQRAAELYREILDLIEEIGDEELYDVVQQVYFAEVRSVEELRQLQE